MIDEPEAPSNHNGFRDFAAQNAVAFDVRRAPRFLWKAQGFATRFDDGFRGFYEATVAMIAWGDLRALSVESAVVEGAGFEPA